MISVRQKLEHSTTKIPQTTLFSVLSPWAKHRADPRVTPTTRRLPRRRSSTPSLPVGWDGRRNERAPHRLPSFPKVRASLFAGVVEVTRALTLPCYVCAWCVYLAVFPTAKCKLRMMKLTRIKDFLLLESEFIKNQKILRPSEDRDKVRLCRDHLPSLSMPPLPLTHPHAHCGISLAISQEARDKVEAIRGSPLRLGTLEEIVDDSHCIIRYCILVCRSPLPCVHDADAS